jgi:hypothetical protein
MPRPLLALAMLAIVALGSGCGGSAESTVADTEGLYLDIGGLKYQIQMSRYLNPADTEDREYLIGAPESVHQPAANEVLFGVWVRVQNTSEETRRSADTWEIHDTQENVYRPLPVQTELNSFVYQAKDLPPNTVIPVATSAAGQGPTQGLLLLFKIKVESLQNRPLELRFSNGPQGQVGTYDLDV